MSAALKRCARLALRAAAAAAAAARCLKQPSFRQRQSSARLSCWRPVLHRHATGHRGLCLQTKPVLPWAAPQCECSCSARPWISGQKPQRRWQPRQPQHVTVSAARRSCSWPGAVPQHCTAPLSGAAARWRLSWLMTAAQRSGLRGQCAWPCCVADWRQTRCASRDQDCDARAGSPRHSAAAATPGRS